MKDKMREIYFRRLFQLCLMGLIIIGFILTNQKWAWNLETIIGNFMLYLGSYLWIIQDKIKYKIKSSHNSTNKSK